jgi:hypothetical protein
MLSVGTVALLASPILAQSDRERRGSRSTERTTVHVDRPSRGLGSNGGSSDRGSTRSGSGWNPFGSRSGGTSDRTSSRGGSNTGRGSTNPTRGNGGWTTYGGPTNRPRPTENSGPVTRPGSRDGWNGQDNRNGNGTIPGGTRSDGSMGRQENPDNVRPRNPESPASGLNWGRSGQIAQGRGTRDYNLHNNEGEVHGTRFRPVGGIVDGRTLGSRVRDTERVGLVRSGYRYGYYGYHHNDWDSNRFFFGFYVYDPIAYDRCVCSPWYYYPCLPPYVAYHRVVIVDRYYSTDWYGSPYDRREDYLAVNRQALDSALDDIRDAFVNLDRRSISHLVPSDGKVNIFTEGNYSYSLNADEFYNVYKDGIQNVKTDSYRILRVERNDRGDARVQAEHSYTDPWGERQTVYHTYYLAREGRDYVIREFGTSYYNKGW